MQATVDDIRACFRLILGREPNPEEWPGHSSRAGQDLDLVVRSFLQCQEFARRDMLSPVEFGNYAMVEINDVTVAVYPDDIDVGAQIMRGVYEPNVTQVFKRTLKPGMRIADIGANCGYFTFLARSLVGESGSVIAVEPNVQNVRLLEAGRRANEFTNVKIVPVAAGVDHGMASLIAVGSNGIASTMGAHDDIFTADIVCQAPLDAIVGQVDFIKLDIEGQEMNALRGFSAGLKQRPILVSEFAPGMLGLRETMGREYLEFLLSYGYTLGVIERDGSVSADCGLTAIMQSWCNSGVDHIDILATPDYSSGSSPRRQT